MTHRENHLRAWSVCLSAAAVIGVPTLGALLGDGEGADEVDSEITPPDYAFAIWTPIFLGIAAFARQHWRAPEAEVNRRTGWWISGAYAVNAAWSIAAQTGRWRLTPPLLAVATTLSGVAYSRAQKAPARGAQRVVPQAHGLLLGWTSVATVVNLFATGLPRLTQDTKRDLAPFAALAAAAGLSGAVTGARAGQGSLALPGVWALGTLAADSRRTPRTRVISAASASLLAVTTLRRLGLAPGLSAARG